MRPNYPQEPGLYKWNGLVYVPNTGATGTGAGWGPPWTVDAGVTASHPTPTATSRATQVRRTNFTHDATANRMCGPRVGAASEQMFWRGNGDLLLGGFYLAVVFGIQAWADNTGRIFVGLSSQLAGVASADGIPVHTVGMMHKSTDGANTFKIVNRAAGAEAAPVALTAAASLAAGQAYLFEMWCVPATATQFARCRLTNYNTGAEIAYADSDVNVSGPGPTTFMGPQVQMSNGAGASSGTPGAFGIDVAHIYCVGGGA